MPNFPMFPTMQKHREGMERHQDHKIDWLAGQTRVTRTDGYAQEAITQPGVQSENFMRPAIMKDCPMWGDGLDKWTPDEDSSITEQKRLSPRGRNELGTEESDPQNVKGGEDSHGAAQHVNEGSTSQTDTVPVKGSTESRLDTILDIVQHAQTTHEKTPGAVGEAEAVCSSADICVRDDMTHSSRPHETKAEIPDELTVRTARYTRDIEASIPNISGSQGIDDAKDLEAYSSDTEENHASEVSRTDGLANISSLLAHEEESEKLFEHHSDQSIGNLLFDTDIEDEDEYDDTPTRSEQGAMTSPSTSKSSEVARKFDANLGDTFFTMNALYIQRTWRRKATQRRMAKARQHGEHGKRLFPGMRRAVEPSSAHETPLRSTESEKGESVRNIQALARQHMAKRVAPGQAVEHDTAGGLRNVSRGTLASIGVHSKPHHRRMRDIDAALKIQNMVRLKLLSYRRGYGYVLPQNERVSGSVSTGGMKIQPSPTAAGGEGAEKMPKREKDGKRRSADSHTERAHHERGNRAKRTEHFRSQLHFGSAGNSPSSSVSTGCSLSSSVPTGDIFSVNFDSDSYNDEEPKETSSAGGSNPQVESGGDVDKELRRRN